MTNASPVLTSSSVIEREPCPCSGCGHNNADAEPGWHRTQGPAPVLGARRGDLWPDRPSWVDHPYRLRQPDRTWTYVAEPYDLGPEAFEDFAKLRAAGWRVTVSGWGARHRPGHTVAVAIRRELPD